MASVAHKLGKDSGTHTAFRAHFFFSNPSFSCLYRASFLYLQMVSSVYYNYVHGFVCLCVCILFGRGWRQMASGRPRFFFQFNDLDKIWVFVFLLYYLVIPGKSPIHSDWPFLLNTCPTV